MEHDLRNNRNTNCNSFKVEKCVCDGKRTVRQQHILNMSAKFQIDRNGLIQEMDLQMGMALNYALNHANDANRAANGVVNDGDCIHSTYVAIAKVNHVRLRKRFLC